MVVSASRHPSGADVIPQLDETYFEALRRVDPRNVIAGRVAEGLRDRPAILLGKCAAAMAEALARGGWGGTGLAVVPAGYEGEGMWPRGVAVIVGSHPDIDERSFAAGRSLLEFAARLDAPALVLVSGGASACVEHPLAAVEPAELAQVNRELVRSGEGIDAINAVRKHLSAIKGGRLAAALPPGSVAWLWSDVPPGRPDLVGSGPMSADPTTLADAAAILARLATPTARRLETLLRSGAIAETPKEAAVQTEVLADNRTFLEAAASSLRESGARVAIAPGQVEGSVESAAESFLEFSSTLEREAVAIAGGEPTVEVRGGGIGGRCSEFVLRALRLARLRGEGPFRLLVGSSDGVDGSSGTAAYLVAHPAEVTVEEIETALSNSDAHPLASRVGRALGTGPTGNNLRDIMLMARG